MYVCMYVCGASAQGRESFSAGLVAPRRHLCGAEARRFLAACVFDKTFFRRLNAPSAAHTDGVANGRRLGLPPIAGSGTAGSCCKHCARCNFSLGTVVRCVAAAVLLPTQTTDAGEDCMYMRQTSLSPGSDRKITVHY